MTRFVLALSVAAAGCVEVAPPDDSPPLAPSTPPRPGWLHAPTPTVSPAPEQNDIVWPHVYPPAPEELPGMAPPAWTSGRGLVWHAGALFVVDGANGDLVVMRAADAAILRRIAVGPQPRQVVVGPDGGAWVSVSHAGTVAYVASEANEVTRTLSVGTEPIGLALSADATTLFVAAAGDSQLLAIDTASMTELARIGTGARPTAVVAGPSGVISVGHQQDDMREYTFGAGLYGTLDFAAHRSFALRRTEPWDEILHPAREVGAANRVMAGVAGRSQAFFAHHLTRAGTEDDVFNAVFVEQFESPDGDPQDPPSGGYGGGASGKSVAPHVMRPIVGTVTGTLPDMERRPGLAVRDPQSHQPLTNLIAQPSDINHHPTWSLAFVTGYGSDNVLVLNTAIDDPVRAPLGIIDVGMAPQAITFSGDGQLAYVLNAHGFTISEIALQPLFEMEPVAPHSPGEVRPAGLQNPEDATRPHVAPIRLAHTAVAPFGTDPLPPDARLGRRIFTYAFNDKISHANRFACRSCHIDGGEDGQVWFIADGPRQTPALAERLNGTGPFNWVGSETELIDNMDRTIARMGGTGLNDEELESLERFLLTGLTAPPNPHRAPEGLTPPQERGRQLYLDPVVGCATCHLGAGGSDGRLHDVGTTTPLEVEVATLMAEIAGTEMQPPRYNTPTLKNLFATAPYLHDGSAASLMEVLDKTATTMGRTDHLTHEQKQDLVAYLLTL